MKSLTASDAREVVEPRKCNSNYPKLVTMDCRGHIGSHCLRLWSFLDCHRRNNLYLQRVEACW